MVVVVLACSDVSTRQKCQWIMVLVHLIIIRIGVRETSPSTKAHMVPGVHDHVLGNVLQSCTNPVQCDLTTWFGIAIADIQSEEVVCQMVHGVLERLVCSHISNLQFGSETGWNDFQGVAVRNQEL